MNVIDTVKWIVEYTFIPRWLLELALLPISASIIYKIQLYDAIPKQPKKSKPLNPALFGVIIVGVECAVIIICYFAYMLLV